VRLPIAERAAVRRQYQSSDPFKVRLETHKRYSDVQHDLDAEAAAALGLTGSESLLDVGCGPGAFLRYLRKRGHRGRLVAFDQSEAMLAEAAVGVPGVRGNAEELPFGAGSFDRVSARHMLYHVPDIAKAVRELGRVAGPSGTVLAMCNIEASYPNMRELGLDCLAAFGFSGDWMSGSRFVRENARPYLEPVFASVEERLLEAALVFRAAEPIVAYMATALPSMDASSGSELRLEMESWLRKETTRRLSEMGGVWRDPKGVVIFVCREPR
jgi:ubiquinone/menaquinone biosynthesis C-methylase UbiE